MFFKEMRLDSLEYGLSENSYTFGCAFLLLLLLLLRCKYIDISHATNSLPSRNFDRSEKHLQQHLHTFTECMCAYAHWKFKIVQFSFISNRRSSELLEVKAIAKIKWLIFWVGWLVILCANWKSFFQRIVCCGLHCVCARACKSTFFLHFNKIYESFPLWIDLFRCWKKNRHYSLLKKWVNRKEKVWLKNQIRMYAHCNIRKIEYVYIYFWFRFKRAIGVKLHEYIE